MDLINKEKLTRDYNMNSEAKKEADVLRRFITFIGMKPSRRLFIEMLGDDAGNDAFDRAGGSSMTYDSLLSNINFDTLSLLVANLRFRWHEILSMHEMIENADKVDEDEMF